jgi:hypothetical protein
MSVLLSLAAVEEADAVLDLVKLCWEELTREMQNKQCLRVTGWGPSNTRCCDVRSLPGKSENSWIGTGCVQILYW